MANRNREYIDFLKQRFDESKFIEFVSDLLNLSSEDINSSMNELKPEQKQFKDTIEYYKFIANYNSNSDKIGTFIVKLTSEGSQNARTAQRTFISTLLNKYDLDASLVAFYQDNEASWRLSFVKKELNFTDKGIKVDLTPAKRFSYLVGENESVHTAQEYLFSLLNIEDRKITLSDIEKVFDVEKVTKKFFEEYKEKYLSLKEFLDKNQDFITESENCDFTSEEFAKKLMGQIVFLYFLQKKGWLGVQIVPDELPVEEYNILSNQVDSVCNNLLEKYYIKSDNKYLINKQALKNEPIKDNVINFVSIFKGTKYDKPWGSGDKQFVRNMFKKSKMDHKDNFFDEYLEPFFYTGLNEYRINQYFVLFNCKIPFLNGGLFEPLNNYRWSSAQFNIPDEMFSNDKRDGILDIFDLYNFTIDEEEPLEKDIAVDPEMLGKIFENLLDVKERQSTGSFYTPREIVHYMCQESLANYIVNKLDIPYDDIIKFIKYGDIITQTDWTNFYNSNKEKFLPDSIWNRIIEIDKALLDIKIADPAVGSGAFPLGMLNEIVKLRDNISSYILIQEDEGIINRNDISTEQLNRDYYSMKLLTIQNSIYAVDLEISAVDIAKLRLWLSLIVDYPNESEPKPLPNLDCKIMQGNSLLDSYEGVPLFSAKELSNNLKKYKRNISDKKHIDDIVIQQSLVLDDEDSNYDNLLSIMLDLQKEYFITYDNKIKKELKEKIENIQISMVQQSLINKKEKLDSFNEIAEKKSKPWFIWELEFFDVFKNNDGFDIVIGNPPYVQLQKDNGELAKLYKNSNYDVFCSSADLYCLFYEKGINLLKQNGCLCYITSNKWMRASYGEKLREYFSKNTNPKLLIDFAGNKVFDSATVDVNILLVEKKKNNKTTYSCTILDNYKNNLWSYVELNKTVNSFDTSDNWVILNPIEVSIKNKIEKYGRRLSEWNISINRGILTGYNDIFIIDKNTKNMLLLKDPKNEEFIKPILRGRDIKRYTHQYADLYIIVIPCGYTNKNSGNESNKEKWFKDNYSALYEYFINKEEELSKTRGTKSKGLYSRDDQGDYWWELRSCKYMTDFNKQKIVYPCIMSKEPCFSFDKNGEYYVIAPGNIIVSEINPDYLLKYLNSKTYYFALRKFYMGGGIEGELKTNRLLLLPVPINNDSINSINDIDLIEKNIQIHLNLSNEEKDYINNFVF